MNTRILAKDLKKILEYIPDESPIYISDGSGDETFSEVTQIQIIYNMNRYDTPSMGLNGELVTEETEIWVNLT